jgi:hypothetical protein
MTETEIAWVAGFLEGEGSFGVYSRRSGYRYLLLQVSSTDRDVLERLRSVVGHGSICGPVNQKHPRNRSTWSPEYRYSTSSTTKLPVLLNAILPYMGERRASKIREMMAAL